MIRPGIRRLFRLPLRGRRTRERELEEEIALHLELRAERLVREGLTPEAARAEARRRFGPMAEARRALGRAARRREGRVRYREWLNGLGQDLRYAGRRLGRHPGFAAVAVLTVALGVGATTAVFGVVEGVLLRPLPYPDADRVHYLWERHGTGGMGWVSAPNFSDWREGLDSFEHVAALTPGGFNASGAGGPERIRGAEVTPDLFPALGLTFALGRGFLAEEGATPASRVAVISHALWQRQFAGRTDVIGRTLALDGVAHAVVGVLAPGLAFPREADVWVPVDLASAEWKTRRGTTWLNVVGRLASGVSAATARRELDVLGAAMAAEHAEIPEGGGIAAVPLVEELVGDVRPALLVLAGAVGVVLLVACVNLAGLFLVRARARGREAAIRRSIGAGRGQLMRQALAETMLLSVAGGALGIFFAYWAVGLLRLLAPSGTPRIEEASLSGPVLLFGLVVSLVAGVLSGLLPAVRESGTDPREGLRSEGDPGGAGGWSRNALVVAQVSLAVVLVAGAAHLLQTFRNLRDVDPGFRTDGVLTAWLPLSEVRYDDDVAVEGFYRDVLRGLRPLPGVAEAGVVSALPLGGGAVNFSFELRDASALEGEDLVAGYQSASAGYFDAMGIPVLRGRGFREGEGEADAPVVLVDEAFARAFFPGADPLEREILAIGDRWRRVVGVVGSVRRHSLRGEPEPMFYVPLGQDPRDAMTLVVRARGGGAGVLAPELRRVVREVDPTQPIASLAPIQDLIGDDLSQSRFTATVLAFFGGATLFLAMLGVYGVLSQMVVRRTREMGIRMALGAGPRQVRHLVLGHGLSLAGFGIAIGIAAAVPAVRLGRSLLYGVSPFQVSIVAGIVPLLVAAGAAASWLPAARATRLDPAMSLRRE